jgi:DNA-binding NtrC family response regulator
MEAFAVVDVTPERDHASDDVALAARSAMATVLITADGAAAVERVARRIHAASGRGSFPFVLAAAATLPIDATVLVETCAGLLDTARGGSLLLTDVEQMLPSVQDGFMDMLARVRTGRVRLMAGTTTSLYERIAGGTFSERLFYQLNIVHVVGYRSRAARSSPVQSASLMG